MNIWSRGQKVFLKMILVAVFFLCAVCLLGTFFFASGGKSSIQLYNPWLLLIGTIVYAGLLSAICSIVSRLSAKALKWTALGLGLVFLTGLLLFGVGTRSILAVDLKAVHLEAVNMLDSGRIAESDYFLEYPYQQNITIIIYYILRLGKCLGVSDYRLIENLAIITADMLTLIFTCLTVKSFRGSKAAVVVEAMMVFNPIFYLYTSFLYSDLFCLPFMMAGFWLEGKARGEKNRGTKLGLMALAGFLFGVGTWIRSTVLFALIATLVVLALKKEWKTTAVVSVVLIAAFALGSVIFRPTLSLHGTVRRSKDDEMPATLFIMMGFSQESEGSYHYSDYLFNKSFDTKGERTTQDLAVIKERLSEMGADDFFRLMAIKITKVWSDGRMGYGASTWNGSREKYGFLYEYTMGDKSILAWYMMQSMRCALYLLLCVYLAVVFWGAERSDLEYAMITLCLGAFVFYAFWEAQPRYSLMWLPVFTILSFCGLDELHGKCLRCHRIEISWENAESTIITGERLNRFAVHSWELIMAASLFISILLYPKYALQVQERSEMRVRQTTATQTHELTEAGVYQTFVPGGAFNRISILFSSKDSTPGTEYCFKLLRENGTIAAEQIFSSDMVQDGKYYNFNIAPVYPKKREQLTIQLTADKDVPSPVGVRSAFEKRNPEHKIPFDAYPGGEMTGEGIAPYTDMTVIITNNKNRPIFSERIFFILSAGTILLEAVALAELKRINRKEEMVDG